MNSIKVLVLSGVILIFAMACKKNKTISVIEPDVNSKFVTFNKDIKPLFNNKCAPCHVENGDRNNKYNDYNTAKTLITGIIGRVIKPKSDPLFMPKNGEKLNATELALLNKWIDDGLLEK
jgi:hypothetical protein